MSLILGSENKKGILENIATFIHNLMKPSANRQEQLLVDICTKLDKFNENKLQGNVSPAMFNLMETMMEQN